MNTHIQLSLCSLIVDLEQMNQKSEQLKKIDFWNNTAKVAFDTAQYIFHENDIIVIIDEAADNLFNGALLFLETVNEKKDEIDNLKIVRFEEAKLKKYTNLKCLSTTELVIDYSRLAILDDSQILITQGFYDLLSISFKKLFREG